MFHRAQDALRRWRMRRRIIEIAIEEPDTDLSDIAFTPELPEGSVCPVTRQTLRLEQTVFQCRRCGTAYSPEGWEFLREMEKGRCCGCDNYSTVFPLTRTIGVR